MKGLAIGLVALGLLAASAATSSAHEYWHGYAHPYHGHAVNYRSYAPLVTVAPLIAPAPLYGYSAYPSYAPAVAPNCQTVAPAPYYGTAAPYYGTPGVTFGYRGHGVAVGVGL